MDSSEPPKKISIAEIEPIFEDYSSIDFLVRLIEKNNLETNPRKRLTKGVALYAEGIRQAIKGNDLDSAALMAKEAICQKGIALKPATTIAPLLYSFVIKNEFSSGLSLFKELLVGAAKHEINTLFDDAVTTVGVRLLNGSDEKIEIINSLLSKIPSQFQKRRLYFEIFSVAHSSIDFELAQFAFRTACQNSIDLWDCDYAKILQTIVDWWKAGGSIEDARLFVSEILQFMENSHPVVGGAVADCLRLISKSVAEKFIGESGLCEGCSKHIKGFTLTDEEFNQLGLDIETKLVTPAFFKRSHYDDSLIPVSEEEVEARKKQFDFFVRRVDDENFDVVIDGANVGYFGVTSWYSTAKREILVRSGRDPNSILPGELSAIPVPVDVCPNFETVQAIYDKAIGLGYTPKIILHARHFLPSERLFGTNAQILKRWQTENLVIESPSFLNDDYCWLLACVRKKRCSVISNDLMRDHHFKMLSQRSFIRWRQRHRFTFKVGYSGVALAVPSPYSTWVQKSDISGCWHVPFVRTLILDQATNKSKPSDALEKNGDDNCDSWLCLSL